jgi:hypothetical protein
LKQVNVLLPILPCGLKGDGRCSCWLCPVVVATLWLLQFLAE